MKEKFQESLQAKVNELMTEIQQQEKQAAHTQTIHLDEMNRMEARHSQELTKRNNENAELREQANQRE